MGKNETKNSDRPPFSCIHLSDGFRIYPEWEKDENGKWRLPENIKKMIRAAAEEMKEEDDSESEDIKEYLDRANAYFKSLGKNV